MTSTVYLPYRFQVGAIYPFLNAIVAEDGSPRDDHFIFDFSRLSFIDGTGFTALCNIIEWLGRRGAKRQFQIPKNRSAPVRYLDDCGFFETYLKMKLSPQASTRSTTIPCTQVRHTDGHAWLQRVMLPWLSNALGVHQSALGSVNTCVKEIFNNIADHSSEQIGCIHLQHYPNQRRIGITVSDFGRGIPDNIRSVYGPMNDGDAILRASQEGITTKGNPRNMGVGLDFLITSVTSNHGSVGIYSYSGALICQPGPESALRNPRIESGSYPGTLVDITLFTDRFVGDDPEEEDLEW